MSGAAEGEAAGAAAPLLAMEGVTKRFGTVVACEGVDLALRRGEVVALLGENGAGKTTLMNVLFGRLRADAGRVRVERGGRLAPLPPGSPRAALEAGVAMVHQHFTLAENLTTLENVVLGRESLLAWRRAPARARVERLMAETGLAVPLDARVDGLGVGARQRVEILKALYGEARALVLDEPTAVLAPAEAERLFETVRALTARGLGVILISHKLGEVMAAANRVVVLRRGRVAGAMAVADASPRALARLMVGREVERGEGAPPGRELGAPVLELDGVWAAHAGARLVDATLAVREGEIVGMAGVSGNGQAALAALVAGLAVPERGALRVAGEAVRRTDPRAMTARGVARTPEDRQRDGLIGAMSVAENLAVERLRDPALSRRGVLRPRAMRAQAEAAIREHDIRGPGPDAPARLLSGGNAQKLLLARALEGAGGGAPRLVLADQPTRGLDVGAEAEVHRRLREAAERGAGVLLISEDLDEVLAVATRVVVAQGGRLLDAGTAAAADREAVGLMMAGGAEASAVPRREPRTPERRDAPA